MLQQTPILGPSFGWAPKSPSGNHSWGSPPGPQEEEEDRERMTCVGKPLGFEQVGLEGVSRSLHCDKSLEQRLDWEVGPYQSRAS